MDVGTDKWSRIKLLFNEALEHNREARAAYLARNCSEEDLRDLVEKLLVCHEQASGFFANSYPARAAASVLSQLSRFASNDVLAERFRITRMIARGGMGEVYEAEDLELHMPVAIKTIRPDILQNPWSLDRFKREVQLAKQVTHPNVCRVFDLFRHHTPGGAEFQSDESYFVSMELLRGETLAERLQRSGKMTTQEAFPLVCQMASALSAAHDAGILHRDFKPGNVVLVPSKAKDGVRLVVTDFGLASRPAGDLGMSLALTTRNEALGTPAYMSPEQIEDRELTPASDIYSFGLVIYETVTGARPFEAQTPISMALKRLTETLPSPRIVVPDLDLRWEAAILKCLEREPTKRFGKAEEVPEALMAVQIVPQVVPAPLQRPGELQHVSRKPPSKVRSRFLSLSRSARLSLIGSFLLLVLLAGAWVFRLGPTTPKLRVASDSQLQLTSDARGKNGILLTDGVRLYFVRGNPGRLELASVAVDGGTVGTIPFSLQDTTIFDLAPLHSEVLGTKRLTSAGTDDLWLMPLFGGSPRQLGYTGVRAAQFSWDGRRIAFISGQDLFTMNADGSQPRRIAIVPDLAQWLRWSPDGSRLRFSSRRYLGGVMQSFLWEVSADGTNLHQLLVGWHDPPSEECCGSWTPDGSFYVFLSQFPSEHADLWALPERQTLLGRQTFQPVRLTSARNFSGPLISKDGKHVFALGTERHGELVRYNAALNEFPQFLGGMSAMWVAFSRFGRGIAYVNYPDKTLWRAKSDRAEEKQITFAPLEVDGFSWSPDETQFAVRARDARNPRETFRIYLVPASGGNPNKLMPGDQEQGVATWSSDGSRLCFGDVPALFGTPVGTEAIHIYDLRTHKLSDLPHSQGLWTCRWSPNGRYIAALTIEGQKLKLYDTSTKTWRLTSAAHVNTPNWTDDSRFIYYDTEPKARSLQRVRVANGKVEFLVSLQDFSNFPGWWSGVSPNNEPLLLRDLGSAEIYSLSLEYR